MLKESVDPNFLKEKTFYLQADFCFDLTVRDDFQNVFLNVGNISRGVLQECCMRKGSHLFVFFH